MAGLLGGGGGPLGALGGATGGLTNTLGGVTGGGGGGPLDAVGGATGGLTNTLGGITGGGGPLDAVGGLTNTLGGIAGGGSPLDAVGGLTSGLLGGGEGLNLIGLVGIGSDDPALLDLNPAEKKTVKAQKAAQAKQNEQKRQAAFKALQEQVKNQGGRPTPQQQQAAKTLQESQFVENYEMQKLDQVLGPTDPQALQQAQQALSQPTSAGVNTLQQQSTGLPQGYFQTYIIDPQTRQPTHLVTFQPIGQAAGGQQFGQAASGQQFGQQPSGGNAYGQQGPAGFGPVHPEGQQSQRPAAPPADSGAGGAGGALGGLLGNGQGLNVAGLLAIGSDEKALLDLNPATKKEERVKQAQELQRQQKIQQAQMQSLKDQVRKQGGPSPEQNQQYNAIQRREAALKQAAGKLAAANQAPQQQDAWW